MKTRSRKVTALFITGLLLVSIFPGGVLAEEVSPGGRELKTAISAPLSPAFVSISAGPGKRWL